MVSYITVGSSYAVKTGNPEGFDPDDVCGKSIAVQTGTFQDEELAGFSEQCTTDGKEKIDILQYSRQSDATTNVVGNKAVAFYADSTVASYAAALTNGQMEVVGGIRDAAPQGIVVKQDDAAHDRGGAEGHAAADGRRHLGRDPRRLGHRGRRGAEDRRAQPGGLIGCPPRPRS